MSDLDKNYNPTEIENKWYANWEEANHFKPGGQKDNTFCIMIPPPNVTGSLHMGHAFEATIMDTLVRFQRMMQKNTLWQVGTDHAGIATQMVVERQLAKDNISRHDLGREDFIEKVWQWKETSGNRITNQLRRMGASVDWTRERFTMDEGLSAAVREVFVQLYDEGLIYRGKRLVNWDPVLHTAISDLEVVSEEENGYLWHINYPLVDGSGQLEVATTRPETLFGDVAVAVHPEDDRFKHLIGQKVKLPLTDRVIPIIGDDYVDREFGTGCLKITPAHDFNDNEVGARHGFEPINIFTDNAQLNQNAPQAYQDMDRFDARKQVIKDLEAQGLLAKIVDHKLMVPRGDRSGAVIEPYLTNQWYVKIESLAKPAIEAVRNKEIRFVPENWENTYYAWMENIQDWCISRQLWWGHRIPAWYDAQGNIYVGRDEVEVREKYKVEDEIELKQDEDVLDTWFSSALWPFSTLGWPEQNKVLDTFYPTSVLVTGFDIIFFWVARMIMFGLKFTGKVPFREIYIHGLIRDSDGQKMSKSKGNVLDPLDLIDGISAQELVKKRTENMMQPQMAAKIAKKTEKEFPEGIAAYGTDALRYTFCSLASTGRNIVFDFGRLEGYRNFCNKLWNAARYVLMNNHLQESDYGDEAFSFSLADKWIHSVLQKTIAEVTTALEQYRFDLAAKSAYEFVWNQYCDWYLELSKPILTNPETPPALLRGTKQTLIDVFETALRLLHPMMPFITEEIWQTVSPLSGRHQETTIMLAKYPTVEQHFINPEAEQAIDWLKQVTVAIRSIRAQMNISPAKPISILCRGGEEQDYQNIDQFAEFLSKLAKLESITVLNDGETPPPSATALAGKLEILIPMKGLIDVEAETQRVQKEISKQQKELEKSEKKLSNPSYVDKAPAAVVEQERERVANAKQAIAKLEKQLADFAKLGAD